jgi:hypothetical protein
MSVESMTDQFGHYDWSQDEIEGLELPDAAPLDSKVLSYLRFPEKVESWWLPMAEFTGEKYGESADWLDFQLHGVIKAGGLSWLARLVDENPKLLVPHETTVEIVGWDALPRPVQDWQHRHRADFPDVWVDELNPIIGVFWPLVDEQTANAEQYALAVRDLPVVLVEFGGWLGFGLTGASMDLSGHIAEAYMRCGFFPPPTLELVREPRFEIANVAICRHQQKLAALAQGAARASEIALGDLL